MLSMLLGRINSSSIIFDTSEKASNYTVIGEEIVYVVGIPVLFTVYDVGEGIIAETGSIIADSQGNYDRIRSLPPNFTDSLIATSNQRLYEGFGIEIPALVDYVPDEMFEFQKDIKPNNLTQPVTRHGRFSDFGPGTVQGHRYYVGHWFDYDVTVRNNMTGFYSTSARLTNGGVRGLTSGGWNANTMTLSQTTTRHGRIVSFSYPFQVLVAQGSNTQTWNSKHHSNVAIVTYQKLNFGGNWTFHTAFLQDLVTMEAGATVSLSNGNAVTGSVNIRRVILNSPIRPW